MHAEFPILNFTMADIFPRQYPGLWTESYNFLPIEQN